MSAKHIKFRNGNETLTLWVEQLLPDGAVMGWCPELENNILVPPWNILGRNGEFGVDLDVHDNLEIQA